MSNCVKCGEICKCLTIVSPDGSVIIDKETTPLGCTFSLRVDSDDVFVFLEYNDVTNQLCLKNKDGALLNCVSLPNNAQTLTLNGGQLCISGGNCVSLPPHPALELSSRSLSILQSGTLNHVAALEVVPSSDTGNTIKIGTDGRIYSSGVNFVDTATVDFEKSSTGDVTAQVKIDPNSTAPVSITQNGIKIDCCPVPPILVDDYTQTKENISTPPINVILNDPPYNCTGTKTWRVINTINGTVTPTVSNTGTDFVFKPANGFSGMGVFTYQLLCNNVPVGSANVYIKVRKASKNTLRFSSTNVATQFPSFDKIIEIDPDCLPNSIEHLFVLIHPEDYEFNGIIPNEWQNTWQYIPNEVSQTNTFDLSLESLNGKNVVNLIGGAGNTTITSANHSSLFTCNNITIVGRLTDGCGDITISTLDYGKNRVITQKVEIKLPNKTIPPNSTIYHYPNKASFPPSLEIGSYYIDDSTGYSYYGNGTSSPILLDEIGISTVFTPTSPNPSDKVEITWGDGEIQNAYSTIQYPGYISHKLSPTEIVSELVGYCGSYIETFNSNGSLFGLAPLSISVSIGAHKVKNIQFGYHIFKGTGVYDVAGMTNLELFFLQNASNFAANGGGVYIANSQDLSSIREFYLHSMHIFGTGLANNELLFPNTTSRILNLSYYYSDGIDVFHLNNFTNSLYINLDVASTKLIDVTGSNLIHFHAQNCAGASWYGTSVVSHIDRVRFSMSGRPLGQGIFKFDNTIHWFYSTIRGINADGDIVAPKIYNGTTYVSDQYIKDEIFISLDKNGKNDGSVEFYNVFGDNLEDYYNPTWDGGDGSGSASPEAKTAIDNLVNKGWIVGF